MGTNFTLIYEFCGIAFILIAASQIVVLIGTWKMWARITGLCLNCWLSLLNLAAIIVTARYRFTDYGKLASHCGYPSHYDDNANKDTDERLYLSDKFT